MTGQGDRMWVVGVAMLVLAGCSTAPRSFHPIESLSPRDFSHESFDSLLRSHVRDGMVDYPAIETDPGLGDYLQRLNRVDPNSLPTREDRLAFWINAYNAFAIKGILDGRSPMTPVGRYRYFIAADYRVGGETINLYDLEQKLLIPDFREPRIHFAIVCASRSCPKLLPWAYLADKLNEQLDRSARAFVNDPTKNRFDRREKVAYLSMIFKWFEDDFAAQAGSLLGYVKRYVADPDLVRELESAPYRVEFLDYDWSLNGLPPKEVQRGGAP